jgi:periplasmic protein TonB
MRRRNLSFAALFSIVLIAGVAWWGEQTHFVFRHPPLEKPQVLVPFTIPPDPPDPVEAPDTHAKPLKDDVAPPSLPDSPAKPSVDDFIEPIEPPRPNVDVRMNKIPTTIGDGGPGEHAFNPSQLDQSPVAIYKARPVYPRNMRADGISGEVMVDFILDPTGRVRNAVPAHSSQREFEGAACDAVGKWKFKPGRKGGHAVFVHMQVPMVFTLSEDGN